MSEQQSIRDETESAIWEALEPRLEDAIDLDLSVPADNAVFGILIGQVADLILASPVTRRIQAEALRDARRKLNEHLLNAHGADYSDYGLQFLHQEADRIERGE